MDTLTSWAGSQADILINLANSLKPVEKLLTGAAYLLGVMFAFKAVYTLKVYGEARTMMASNSSIKEPILYLVVAAVFIYFPSAFAILLNSTFGYSNVLAYAPINSHNQSITSLFGPDSAAGPALALIIQVIGLAAFIRGWVLIAKGASQGQAQGGTGKGLMHVFGGIMAMNIVGTLQIINNTLYGTG